MDNDEQTQPKRRATDQNGWTAAAVSWGQLLIALSALVGAVFLDRLALDRRMTVVEERQIAAARDADRGTAELALIRADVGRRLDDISGQLTRISVDMARAQSVGERLTDLERRLRRDGNGVR